MFNLDHLTAPTLVAIIKDCANYDFAFAASALLALVRQTSAEKAAELIA